MSNALVLQINSLQSLERLIGNDNEIEIGIRNSIVQEFSKKHLKCIINDYLIRKLSIDVKREVLSEILEKVNDNPYSNEIYLSESIMKKLKEKMEAEIWDRFYELIDKLLERDKIRILIAERLEFASNRILEALSDADLEKRLSDMVDKKIRLKLNV